jgi:hypothetical protein
MSAAQGLGVILILYALVWTFGDHWHTFTVDKARRADRRGRARTEKTDRSGTLGTGSCHRATTRYDNVRCRGFPSLLAPTKIMDDVLAFDLGVNREAFVEDALRCRESDSRWLQIQQLGPAKSSGPLESLVGARR